MYILVNVDLYCLLSNTAILFRYKYPKQFSSVRFFTYFEGFGLTKLVENEEHDKCWTWHFTVVKMNWRWHLVSDDIIYKL